MAGRERRCTVGSADAWLYDDDVIEPCVDGADCEPVVPEVGEVRMPGVVTGVPFPRFRSLVQPKAERDADSETARSARVMER